MKKKIFLYFIILILTGVSITGFFVTQLARNLYKEQVKEKILIIASLFDRELSEHVKNGNSFDFNALTQDYANILSTKINNSVHTPVPSVTELNILKPRITLIDFNGKVLGESQTDYNRMENHIGRREIQLAIRGLTGEDIRFSSTLGMDFLYIAIASQQPNLIVRVSVPLDQLKIIDMKILFYSILGMLAGLLISTLLAYRFATDISRPVKELTTASREIADGNYLKRVKFQKKDELGQLAATFNDMAVKLEITVADLTDKNEQFDAILNSMTYCFVAVDSNMKIILMNAIAVRFFSINENDAIGRKFVEVIRNHQLNEIIQKAINENVSSVSELTLSFPESKTFSIYASPIKSAKGEPVNSGGIISLQDITTMKRLEQIRTEFVSNVTHELKTPLTSIRGFAETLRNGAIKDPKIALKFLEIIDIEAERLTMLINDILQLSEIENNINDTNISEHNLTDIVNEVVSILQGSADKKGVKITVNTASKINIHANSDRIKQMLINLVDNAIKYNVEHGSVCIQAAKADGRLIITIADTGIGIAEQHQSRIFERFYRVDKGRSRNMGGTGLGLSIVKHIVNLYNGDINIESHPGKGTKFIIQLPV